MIKAVIFDIGNVLLRFDISLALNRLASKSGTPIEEAMQTGAQVSRAYESGRIDRAEFMRRLMEILQYSGTRQEFVAAWEAIFTENEPMTKLVAELHRDYPLYLLSNTNDIHVEYMFREYPFFGLFRDAVYSHVAGCMKPDREIYEIAVKQFGIHPEETLFIDDLGANIQTARESGLVAIQYDYNRHGEFIQEIAAAGVNAGRSAK